MGSKCSILNDTEHDLWIAHGINWKAVYCISNGLLGLVNVGAIVTPTLVEKDWERTASALLHATNVALSKVRDISQSEDENFDWARSFKKLQEFQQSCKRVKPGEKYTWEGTLSLHMCVYVMNDDKSQYADRICFTGPTNNSEKVYPISEYFVFKCQQ